MKTEIIYYCEHCGLQFDTKKETLTHERTCTRNPKLKKCVSCANYRPVPWDADQGIAVCTKLRKQLPNETNCPHWDTKEKRRPPRIKFTVCDNGNLKRTNRGE